MTQSSPTTFVPDRSEVDDGTDGLVLGSIQAIDVSDLPIPRIEIELSSGRDSLAPAASWGGASRVMALVRLHTHPMGVVFLDAQLGVSSGAHAEGIWTALKHRINAHLVADGLPTVDGVADLIVDDTSPDPPRCLRQRAATVADAPLISVVVATRDRPESLRACLDCLLRMDYPRFEIVVVDNDPTTIETATMVAQHYETVRYVRENRRGLASAHNCGLQVVRGRIVAFVDDDVLIDDQWLAAIVEGFAQGENVGCVTGLILPEQLETPAQLMLEHRGGYGRGFDLVIVDTGRHRPADPLFPFAAGRLGSGANMAFDVQILRDSGGFDEALGVGTIARGGDDLSGFFRTVVAGHQLVYQPDAIVWHRHYRDMTALRNMARGCGVGLGAYLTSCLVHEPRMVGPLLRSVSAGLAQALRRPAGDVPRQQHPWPAELARIERRGLLVGPAAYAVSRWRAWRAASGPDERPSR